MPSRCCEFVDSRLRRSPPDRASAVPYGQAGENAMRFPHLAHRSAAAHKLHSATATTRYEFDSGKGETISRLPALAYSPRKLSKRPGPTRILAKWVRPSSPAGCATMVVSTPRSFGKNSARLTPSLCGGRLASTNGSRVTSWRPGVGCARSSVAIQACSPTGHWDPRSDDGSRMNREVHVRFWESAGLRCPATRLPQRLCDGRRGQDRHRCLAQLLQRGAPAPEPRLSHAAANLPARPVDMWTIGFADRLRFPASRASSEGGEMLTFAHIPTGTAANKGFDIDEVNSRLVEPAVALTAIGADIETGRATP